MFNISDLIAIALVALAMFLGYKRGFVKTSFRVLSFILALILSLVLYKPVGNLIKKHTGVETWIVSVVTGTNKEKSKEEIEEVELEENKTEENEIEEGVKNLPQNIKDYLDVDSMCEGMPNTNNKIEGTFTDLKKNLNNHSGMSVDNRKRFIIGFLLASGKTVGSMQKEGSE